MVELSSSFYFLWIKPRPLILQNLDPRESRVKEGQLKDALLLINPNRLVSVYSYERKFINPEDEARWKVVMRYVRYVDPLHHVQAI